MFDGLFQPLHLVVILAIVLIIFGPGKLPEIGAGLGKTLREFKKAMAGGENTLIKHEEGPSEADPTKKS